MIHSLSFPFPLVSSGHTLANVRFQVPAGAVCDLQVLPLPFLPESRTWLCLGWPCGQPGKLISQPPLLDWGGHMTWFWLTRCTWKMLNGASEEHFKRGSGLLSFFFLLLGMKHSIGSGNQVMYEAMLSRKTEGKKKRKTEGTGFLRALCGYLAVLE